MEGNLRVVISGVTFKTIHTSKEGLYFYIERGNLFCVVPFRHGLGIIIDSRKKKFKFIFEDELTDRIEMIQTFIQDAKLAITTMTPIYTKKDVVELLRPPSYLIRSKGKNKLLVFSSDDMKILLHDDGLIEIRDFDKYITNMPNNKILDNSDLPFHLSNVVPNITSNQTYIRLCDRYVVFNLLDLHDETTYINNAKSYFGKEVLPSLSVEDAMLYRNSLKSKVEYTDGIELVHAEDLVSAYKDTVPKGIGILMEALLNHFPQSKNLNQHIQDLRNKHSL